MYISIHSCSASLHLHSMAMIFNIFDTHLTPKQLEVCFSSSCQCHAKNIAQCMARFQFISNILVSSVVLPYIFCILCQEFKTSSCECEFSFGYYCLHFTTTDNQNFTYYYSHFLNYEHYNTALGLSLWEMFLYNYVFFISIWCFKTTDGTNLFQCGDKVWEELHLHSPPLFVMTQHQETILLLPKLDLNP